MYLRKVMRMTASDRYILKPDLSNFYPKGVKRKFTITNNGTGRSYILEADPWTTLDLVWISEKRWFVPGSSVTITDDKGNSQTFVKEK